MQIADHVYAVILAGGSGTRFWPKSRQLTPKQLCAIGDQSATMLEITLKRLDGFIPPERRMIVTHHEQIEKTREIAGEACGYYLAEPEARNTANALALAALDLENRHEGSSKPIMVSLHADHMIRDENAFRAAIVDGISLAEEARLALIGIVPTHPETGYGYIEQGDALKEVGFNVKSFREKPERSIAEEFLASGNFLWNAGIFVWQTETVLGELRTHLAKSIQTLEGLTPENKSGFAGVDFQKLTEAYASLPKISIDHAVLEVSKNVSVVAADIGWQDVGSWDALDKCFEADSDGNLSFGDNIMLDCSNTTVDTDGDLVAAIGVSDLVIVKAKGAVLVCPRSRAQEVKKIVGRLENEGRREYL